MKTRKMFFMDATAEKNKSATIIGHFKIVLEENSVREITWLSWRHSLQKYAVLKCFLSTQKWKAGNLIN